MPTVPMYCPNAAALSWRGLFYPGGGEYFELKMESSGLRMLMQIGNGNPYNTKYARQYRQFIRRPTRHAPPLPVNYPFALLQVNAMERLRSNARPRDYARLTPWENISPNESRPLKRPGLIKKKCGVDLAPFLASQKVPHPNPLPAYQGRGKCGIVPAQSLNEVGALIVAGPSSIAIGPARIALIEGYLQSDWREEDLAMSFSGKLLSEIHNHASPGERCEEAEVAGAIKLSWSNLKLDQNISGTFSHVMRWGFPKISPSAGNPLTSCAALGEPRTQ